MVAMENLYTCLLLDESTTVVVQHVVLVYLRPMRLSDTSGQSNLRFWNNFNFHSGPDGAGVCKQRTGVQIAECWQQSRK
jgi:hypothetical protein